MHCSRKATSNPRSTKLPAFSIICVNILTRWRRKITVNKERGSDPGFRSRDDEGQEESGEKPSKSAKAIRLLREAIYQIDVSFSCVCPVIDHEFRHNIVKDYFDPGLLIRGEDTTKFT